LRIYLDSSALVKLVQLESESRALEARLNESTDEFVTSTLARVEVTRAVLPGGPDALELVRRHFLRISHIIIDAEVIESAAMIAPNKRLRSLDAIHLATALLVGADLRSIITYDAKMSEAAQGLGLVVEAPH
jgi:predicted nucleic acid-binding protein